MIQPATQLRLLGLAEPLGATQIHLGDPRAEALLGEVLDRVLDAVVDIVQDRAPADRPVHTAQDVGREEPSDLRSADRASCSALAADCHRLADHLEGLPGEDRRGAERAVGALRLVADGLQDLTQSVLTEPLPAVRQQLLRVLHRASARLEPPAP